MLEESGFEPLVPLMRKSLPGIAKGRSRNDAAIIEIRDAGLDTVAVSCLFSFLNDVHERRVGERLRQALPGIGVYLSCEVLPEIREFERASATAVGLSRRQSTSWVSY